MSQQCPPGQYWRPSYTRTLKSGQQSKPIPGQCIKRRGAGKKPRKTPVRVKSGCGVPAGKECQTGCSYRSEYNRKLRSGAVKSFAASCVKARSPRQGSPRRRSPQRRSRALLSKAECSNLVGHYWREGHERKLRNGAVLKLKGTCVKSPSHRAKPTRSRSLSPKRSRSPVRYRSRSVSPRQHRGAGKRGLVAARAALLSRGRYHRHSHHRY